MKTRFAVNNFEYNGFYGRELPGQTDYTAEFKEWTSDPGVAVFKCSDGEERLIPTFALAGIKKGDLPKQDYKNGKAIFGYRCHS